MKSIHSPPHALRIRRWSYRTEIDVGSKRLAVLIAAVLVLVAIVAGVAVRDDIARWFGNDARAGRDTAATGAADGVAAPSQPVASATASAPDAGHLDAFREFVMIDREREPDWMAQITRVTFSAAGELTADTTLPSDWRDSTTRTRPAESICTQLFAYAQRGVKRPWNTISVRANDGTPLVTRTQANNTCRQ
jgi:hypothetical protein